MIGYLGPEGTYSDMALQQFLSHRGITETRVPCESLPQLFDHLSQGKLTGALVPVENAIEGTVTVTMDHLVSLPQWHITDESIIRVDHALMSEGNLPLSDVQHVYSHPQPLHQCRQYIHHHLPQAELHEVSSTAKGVSHMKRQPNSAVIGSLLLAEMYDLTVLSRSISDIPGNSTRFVFLSKQDTSPTGSDKTSIVFTTQKDQPGSLQSVLTLFSQSGINLVNIFSRPSKTTLGEYLFFVDCDGHSMEAPLKSVLKDVEKQSAFFKWLGSYPKGELAC